MKHAKKAQAAKEILSSKGAMKILQDKCTQYTNAAIAAEYDNDTARRDSAAKARGMKELIDELKRLKGLIDE